MIWPNTTASELAAIVSEALQDAGITAVLSGGAVVQIYSEGRYVSKDLDFVTSASNREIGPISAYALAQNLQRNYSTVYKDLATLRKLGLVERDEGKRVYVPWDTIHIELQLAA